MKELVSDLMGQKKIFAVVRVLNGVGLIVRALHKDAFWQEKFQCIFFIKLLILSSASAIILASTI